MAPISERRLRIPAGNTYVTAVSPPDGTLAVIYNPAANTQTITVNGSLMNAGIYRKLG